MSFRREQPRALPLAAPAPVAAAAASMAPMGALRSDATQLRPDVAPPSGPTRSVSLHVGESFRPKRATRARATTSEAFRDATICGGRRCFRVRPGTTMPLSTTLDLDAMFAARTSDLKRDTERNSVSADGLVRAPP